MAPSSINFDVSPPVFPADPNRMDIAMFVGFLPLRDGAEAARQAVADELTAKGWAARADDRLVDVPVRVRSISDVEDLWDTGGRLDRIARVRGIGLGETVGITAEDATVIVNVDGDDLPVALAPGSMTRVQIRDALNALLTGVEVTLDTPDVQGRAAILLTRTASGQGSVTVYANPSLGFPVAQRDATGVSCCPTGAALRHFFAMGGREAYVVAMGAPPALFPTSADRIAALSTLIGGGYGAGASAIADLDGTSIPGLPGAYPPREPWHGLAHLHGLEDVALVCMPDLAELVSNVSPVEAQAVSPVRPPERFTVCAPEPEISYDGQAVSGTPARASDLGLDRWAKLTAWAVAETAAITREAMLVIGAPLPDTQGPGAISALITGNSELSHPQLQVVGPWVQSPLTGDMPGRASLADGVIAGAIAARTLEVGAWRTVAGIEVPYLLGLLGDDPTQTPDTAPELSLIGGTKRGFRILSDRTTDQVTYAQANIRRLMGSILRAARHRGEVSVFDANGPVFWRSVINTLTGILRNLRNAGALRGNSENDAFEVRCGPETMHQSDIDAGRVIAEVAFRPAHSLEKIEISFTARGGVLAAREAA